MKLKRIIFSKDLLDDECEILKNLISKITILKIVVLSGEISKYEELIQCLIQREYLFLGYLKDSNTEVDTSCSMIANYNTNKFLIYKEY